SPHPQHSLPAGPRFWWSILAHVPRPHEGQPLESRPLSLRISDVANTLGSPCHGPIHASDHWIWRSARNRGWLRTLPDVQSSHSKTNYSISNITIMAIERMQGWTGARQNRAWTDLARLSVSVLIVGGTTVVGYIRHPWRHDVRQTTGCIFSYAFRDLSNLRWTVEF